MNLEKFTGPSVNQCEARLGRGRVVERVAAVCVRRVPAGKNGEMIEALVIDGCYPSTSMCWDYLENPPPYVWKKDRD